MRLVILSAIILGSLGAPAVQNLSVNEDGTYEFSYETGDAGGSHSRTESKGTDGVVTGKYSYKDPTGQLRVVNYRSDDDTGFLSSEGGEVPQPSASDVSESADNSEKEEEKKEEAQTTTTTEATTEDDDENSLKLEEPIDDGPPEGFPPGFFSEQFSALRRLPDPKSEETPSKRDESKTDESDAAQKVGQDLQGHISSILEQPEGFPPGFFLLHHFTGLRRLEPPLKEESPQTIDDTSGSTVSGVTTAEGTNPVQGFYSSYVVPFPSLVPHLLQAPSYHHPVYVYSRQEPNAYSYGYHY